MRAIGCAAAILTCMFSSSLEAIEKANIMVAQDGFGRNATGGAGGTAVTVTNASDLMMYAAASSPYIITVSGTITYPGYIPILSNKTIQGADSNATINADLRVSTGVRNVIIQDLNLTNPSHVGDGDGITIFGSKNVYITHCTFTDCADGSCDITEQADSVTLSWCRFRYVHQTTHRLVNLIGSSDTAPDTGYLHVTIHHCWYDQLCNERMPSVRFGRVHIYNNYYSSDSALYCVRTRLYAECLVENNYFGHVKNPWEVALSIAPGTITGKVHAANNNISFMETTNGITWIDGWYKDASIISALTSGTDAVFTLPYSYTLDNAQDVKSIVMTNAGNKKSGTASVDESALKITGFALCQNFPNPFNPSTTINFEIPKSGVVSLKVYDIYGREIATLVEGIKSAGSHTAEFNGSNLSSGVYFARLRSNSFSQTVKLILAK
ncbi:MAG: T9SS type A sorting domain-containing protein [Bacteroidota bacterium]